MPLVVLGSAVLFCVYYALHVGLDINWDLRNYHVYSVYAFLHDRLVYDVAPGQRQTWTNPFGVLLPYFAVMFTRPVIGSVIMAACSAVNILLVYLIASELFRQSLSGRRWAVQFLSILCALAAGAGPVFLSLIGVTMNDNWVAAFLLAAVYFAIRDDSAVRQFFWSGLCLGLAVALKLTALIYIPGLALAVLVLNPRRFHRQALAAAGGFLVTFIPFGAIWMVYMYRLFDNPVMPLYNDIFKSDLYPAVALKDTRFLFHGVDDFFSKFIEIAAGAHPTTEVGMVDLRYLVFAIFLSIFVLVFLDSLLLRGRRSVSQASLVDSKKLLLLLIFVITSLLLWGLMFGIGRYAVALEQLIPLCTIGLLAVITQDVRRLLIMSFASVALLLVTTVPANWGKAKFSDSWFELAFPPELQAGDQLFVMLSGEPMAYVIPYLPATDRFVRFEGNLPISADDGLGKRIRDIVAAHDGPIMTLSPESFDEKSSSAALATFGLKLADDGCFYIENNVERLKSCKLIKSAVHSAN
ncbi:glycosyltransferase 87 family protein [Martelella sp. HB161492]|uniref:glycosyltransferase 87 family protein n=1 Tax=Martelella sp. HB161492 TaxID=2720726 RepID=UPI0015922D66|nr:glycosyltransferase 87 family protein [Martelella sp. HB161492]